MARESVAATMAHQVYLVVKERIVDGCYGQGTRLTEQQLAQEFETSRTPVREAMRRLAADGFVDFKPNSGTVVRSWSSEEIRQIFELRVLIEGEIAGLAALHISVEAVQRLRVLQDEMEAAGMDTSAANTARIAPLNREFHRVIASASHDERLVATLANAIEMPIVQRTFRTYTRDELQRSFRQHREMIEAFAAHDAGWARSAMACHIHAAKRTLLAAAAQEAAEVPAKVAMQA
jgi:DNA-binding GntR family transcriptional regulator